MSVFDELPGDEEEAFQSLADGAPLMIWMSGLDMGCFYFNKAWLDFRGRTLAEESGNGWAEGVHPEDLQQCVNHYVLCFERRVSFAMTYRLQNRDGEYRWLLDRGAPHHSPDGTFLGFFGGCAELEAQSPSVLNARLRTSLDEVKEFARRIGEEDVLQPAQFRSNSGAELKSLARGSGMTELERQKWMNHAKIQMEQLAQDMLKHSQLQPGAHLP